MFFGPVVKPPLSKNLHWFRTSPRFAHLRSSRHGAVAVRVCEGGQLPGVSFLGLGSIVRRLRCTDHYLSFIN